jgi:hypothetical protein
MVFTVCPKVDKGDYLFSGKEGYCYIFKGSGLRRCGQKQ